MSLKKNLIAFLVIGIIGTLSHFVYEWSGRNYVVGLFFPVNESVWEHLKLLFFPTLIYSAIEYIKLEEKPKNYISAIAFSYLCGSMSIIAIFYTVRGVLGFNVDFINLLTYFIGIIVMLSKKTKIINEEKFSSKAFFAISLSILAINLLLFILWSYNPPILGIFSIPK